MISNVKANSILNALTRQSTLVNPTNLYLGLCFTKPKAYDGEINDEVAAYLDTNPDEKTGYERVHVYEYNAKAAAAVKQYFCEAGTITKEDGNKVHGVIQNNEEIQFKTAKHAWSTSDNKIMYWFLSDSKAGNAFIWGEITDASDETGATKGIVVGANTVPTFYEGQLQASIDVALPVTTTEATE